MDLQSSAKKPKQSSSEIVPVEESPIGAEDSDLSDYFPLSRRAYRFPSAAVENVFDSLMHDPIVWDAVQKNEAVRQYLQEQQTRLAAGLVFGEHSRLLNPSSSRTIKSSYEDGELRPRNNKRAGIMSSLFGFFRNLFGVRGVTRKTAKPNGIGKLSLGTSVTILAIATFIAFLVKGAQSQNIRVSVFPALRRLIG